MATSENFAQIPGSDAIVAALQKVEKSTDYSVFEQKGRQWVDSGIALSKKHGESAFGVVDKLDARWEGVSADQFTDHMEDLTSARFAALMRCLDAAGGVIQQAGRDVQAMKDETAKIGDNALAAISKVVEPNKEAQIRDTANLYAGQVDARVKQGNEKVNVHIRTLNEIKDQIPKIFNGLKLANDGEFTPSVERNNTGVVWSQTAPGQESDTTGKIGDKSVSEYKKEIFNKENSLPDSAASEHFEYPQEDGRGQGKPGETPGHGGGPNNGQHGGGEQGNQPGSGGGSSSGSDGGGSGSSGESGGGSGSGGGSSSDGGSGASYDAYDSEDSSTHADYSSGSGGNGAQPAAAPPEVRAWIEQAKLILEQQGIHLSPEDIERIEAVIMKESGGDPDVQNNWDSNAAKGTPSIGLMQTIGPTFESYKLENLEQIAQQTGNPELQNVKNEVTNPIANIVAGVRYTYDRYGSMAEHPGISSMESGGGYQPY